MDASFTYSNACRHCYNYGDCSWLFLLIGFKTELFAKLSGLLMLIFALSMTFSVGIKRGFDYSVFTASAAVFGLSLIRAKYLEVDSLMDKK